VQSGKGLLSSSTLKIETVCSFETLIPTYQTARWHIQKATQWGPYCTACTLRYHLFVLLIGKIPNCWTPLWTNKTLPHVRTCTDGPSHDPDCEIKKTKLFLCLIRHHVMNMYGGVAIYLHAFLTSAIQGGEWSAWRLSRFTPEERAPGTHWKGRWVGPRAGLDTVKRKIPSTSRESNSDSLVVQSIP
jgi:hypothetical protein